MDSGRSDNSNEGQKPVPGGRGTAVVWKRILERPPRLLASFLALVVVAAVCLLGSMAWRDLGRLERIRGHVEHTARLQSAGLELQESALLNLTRNPDAALAVRQDLREEVAALRAHDSHLDPHTGSRLERLARLIEPGRLRSRENLMSAVTLVGEIARDERQAEARLLEQISNDARRELQVVIAIFAALPVLGLLGYWNLRQRILKPLGDLRVLLAQLTSGSFAGVSPREVHPALAPVFENYNRLVARLQTLEAEHESRARSLESEVRAATQALFDQQRTLARTERLAVVGEMAAGLAHELRNPLAGVLMSLGNLRRDVSDPDLADRLSQVIAEIERLTRLLNQHLSSARHAPESSRPVNLARLVQDLLALLRYQVPPHVHLQCDVPADLECTIPRDRVRQALLNLIINSVQALDGELGHVNVSAGHEDGRVVLSVSDDGPGFPAELLGADVQPFVTHRNAGTGLGLAMVRRLVQDLGGDLQLDNVQPRGARVRLMLPCPHG